MLASAETPLFAAEEAKNAIIGLARDIRGLAFAFNTKISYMMFFEWVYPNYISILLRAMELWYHDPQVNIKSLDIKLSSFLAWFQGNYLLNIILNLFNFFRFQVTTPVLKLFAELVQNRSQRLQFDASSPNGFLLFREASKVICTYG